MNPTVLLAEQLIQYGVMVMTGLLAGDNSAAQFNPVFSAALAANRPLTPDEWAPIQAAADAAHNALQNA